jgi:hypothetical protein
MRPWGEDDVRPTETGYELSDAALDEIMSASFGEDSKMSNKLTWGYIKDWAIQNNVTDDAVIGDMDTGEFAIDISFTAAIPEQDDPAVIDIEFGDDE